MKKSFTKVLAGSLAASMVLGLAACGSSDSGSTTQAAAETTKAAEAAAATTAAAQEASSGDATLRIVERLRRRYQYLDLHAEHL
ncbi:hypothetical protein [Oribacterium sp. HCP3S3_B9]|uniref:hypothetical protein n=1 Tax=Oribacterium sp. HCP3S3_B9 TaxID=3438946 RepID=UPI003F8CB1AD